MKKVLSILALSGMLAASAFAGTWTGQISDEKCGAKVNGDCAKKCIEGGQKAVFVNDKDGKVIPIADAKSVAGHEGHHVKVTGSMKGGVLTVKKVTMVADKGMSGSGMGDMK